MESLSNILYWLSSGLFVPVMLGTVIMFMYALYLTGTFYGSYKEYGKYKLNYRETVRKSTFQPLIEKLNIQNRRKRTSEIDDYIIAILKNYKSKSRMESVLNDFELAAEKKMGKYRTLAKLGPILGLMGTLIPMGPALAGLGQGDVSSMSWNMQVAFSTTVIGLFAGTIGFLLLQPRQRMLICYLTDLEVLVGNIDEYKTDNAEEYEKLEKLLTEKFN